MNITAEQYHIESFSDVPMLSSSIAKLIINDSPLHAWTAHPKLNPNWKPEDTKERDFGSIVHGLMLEGHSKAALIHSLDKDGNVVTDYKTKGAREERDAYRAERKIPILQCDWERIAPMLEACRRQLEAHKDAANAFTNGAPERSLTWREDNGVMCKARLDYLHADLRYIDDLKTRNATANPEPLSRTLFNEGWDIQAAFYIRGVKKVYPEADPIFRFICLETFEPFALSVISLTPGALILAERKVEDAIRIFGDCLKSGHWPGYPDRTCYAEVPAWMEAQQMEKEFRSVSL